MALIYGSYAKDSMRPDSDIDVMLVVADSKAEDKLVAELSRLEKTLGRVLMFSYGYLPADGQQRKTVVEITGKLLGNMAQYGDIFICFCVGFVIIAVWLRKFFW